MGRKNQFGLLLPLVILGAAACDPMWHVAVNARIGRPLQDACVIQTLESLPGAGPASLLTTTESRSWPPIKEGELLRQYSFTTQGQKGVMRQAFRPGQDANVSLDAYYIEIGWRDPPDWAIKQTQPALALAAASVLRQCVTTSGLIAQPLSCDPDAAPCRAVLLDEYRKPLPAAGKP